MSRDAAYCRIGPYFGGTPTGKTMYIDDLSIAGINPAYVAGSLYFQVSPGVTVKSIEMRSGIAGTVIASLDLVAVGTHPTTITDAQGNVWTVEYA
mgnify:CR=1 FL=1